MPVLAAAIGAIAKVAAPLLPIAIKEIKDALKKGQVREKDLLTLQFYLNHIQVIIRETRKIIIRSADNPSVRDRVQSWTANLRCLAYDIEDLIAGHRAKTMTGAGLSHKIAIIQGLLDFINSAAYAEFMMIPNEDSQSGTSSSTSSAQITHPNPKTEKDFPLADLVGKEEHLRELLDLVRRHDTPLGTNDLNLKVMVISVVGFDGVGETKLCHNLHRAVQNNKKFSRYAFVSAAGMSDNSMVLKDIIQQLLPQEDPQDSNGGILHRLLQAFRGDHNDQVQNYIRWLDQHLKNQRYFIMVDGVKSEELIKHIASVFPDNNMGSRIIMGMTVVGKDAERCDGHIFKMRPLQDEQSVTRFLNKAERRPRFSFEEQDCSLSSLQKICDGVPLALVSVCEVRRGSSTIHAAAAVEEACRELRKAEEDRWPHRMPVVLHYSYDSLHNKSGNNQNQYIPYLQACLLYFAMFPRGNVKRGTLIRRWQAEGLEFGGNNQAAENLKTLVDRNFIWSLHESMNEHQHPKTCQPPRVVLDYISNMSEMEQFILKTCPSGQLTPNYSRRLCLHQPEPEEGRPEPSVITDSSVPPRLRTLAVSLGHQQACSIAECEQLRVLDMQSYRGLEADQLDKICQKLRLLKYLSLLPNTITELPKSMSNLKCLETLELEEVKGRAAVLVPIEVISLPCLKHLIGKFELFDILHGMPVRYWPKALVKKDFKNSSLESLSGFFTRRGQGFPLLMCHMRLLRKVKIWFHSDAEAKYLAGYLPKAITKFLKNDNVHHSLSLDFQDCPNPRELLLACIEKASGKLDSLKLSGKNLSKIHLFVITYNTKLTGITKLCLSRWQTITLDAAFLDELSKLSHLKYLKLDAETIKAPYDDNPRAGNNQEKVVIESRHIENLQGWCLVAKQTLPDIQVNPTALQRLVSLHLISAKPDYCPSYNIICKANGQAATPLMNLKEVSLNSIVPEHLRSHWHEAAWEHPNNPQILFVQDPERAE